MLPADFLIKTTSIQTHTHIMTKIKPGTTAAVKELVKPKKQNNKIWQGFQKLVEPYDAPPPPTYGEQGDLLNIIKGAFGEQLEHNSSVKPVNQHFEGLFTGLGVLTEKTNTLLSLNENQLLSKISKCKDENTLLKMFDELYYHGKLSYSVALAILRHKSVNNIDKLCQEIAYGGSLTKWDNYQRHAFKLHAANKYFSLKQPAKAKEIIIDRFENEWVPVLKKLELDSKSFVGLGRALLALNGRDLLLSEISKWNKDTFQKNNDLVSSNLLIPLWTACIQVKDYKAAFEIIKVAKQLQAEHALTPTLFIHYLFALHNNFDTALTTYLKTTQQQLDRLLVSLPIDTEKQLDAPFILRMLDFTSLLQKQGFNAIVEAQVELFDCVLENVLSESCHNDMISLALATQKLKVLHSFIENPEMLSNEETAIDPVHYVEA